MNGYLIIVNILIINRGDVSSRIRVKRDYYSYDKKIEQ